MSPPSSLSSLASLYPREAGELQALLRRHGISTGTPEDIAKLPPRLAASAALEEDLLALLNTSRERPGGPVSLSATLHLLLTTLGGPGAGELGPEFDEPSALLSSFLEAMGGWPELAFPPFDDDLAAGASAPAANAPATAPTEISNARTPRAVRSIAASLATQAGLGDAPWREGSTAATGSASATILNALARLEASSAETSARLDALADRLAVVDLHLTHEAPARPALDAAPVPSTEPIASPPSNSTIRVETRDLRRTPAAPPGSGLTRPTPVATGGQPTATIPAEAAPTADAGTATVAELRRESAAAPTPPPAWPATGPEVTTTEEKPDPAAWNSALLQTSPPRSASSAPARSITASATPAAAPVVTPARGDAARSEQIADYLAPEAAASASPEREAIAAWSELFAAPPAPRRSAALIPFAILAFVLLLVGLGTYLFLHYRSIEAEPAGENSPASRTTAAPSLNPNSTDAADPTQAAPPLSAKSSGHDVPASNARGGAATDSKGSGNRVLGAREAFQPKERGETLSGQAAFVAASTMDSRLVYAPRPQHPHVTGAAALGGMVVMEVVVDQDGNVNDVRVLGGQHQLRDAAVNAVRHWRYHPVFRDGKPIAVRTIVRLDFKDNG